METLTDQNWLLSVGVFLPLLGVLVMLFIPRGEEALRGGAGDEIDRRIAGGEWVAVEGSLRGVYKGHPFATRFATWLQVPGDRIARQIDYVDYATFRRMTSPPKAP